MNKAKAEMILGFASGFALGVDPNLKSTDHPDFLYGEDGLPIRPGTFGTACNR